MQTLNRDLRLLLDRIDVLEGLIIGGLCNFAAPCGNCERCHDTQKKLLLSEEDARDLARLRQWGEK